MKISQQVGLVLSGAVAFNSWLPAVAQENEAKPNWPTAPVHEAPPQSWPEEPKAPANAPNVEVNVSNDHSDQLVATQTLRPGLQHIELAVTPDSAAASASPAANNLGYGNRAPVSGSVHLSINGAPAGQAQFSSIYAAGETLDVGSDLGSPVSLEYRTPYRFTGEIEKVTVELK